MALATLALDEIRQRISFLKEQEPLAAALAEAYRRSIATRNEQPKRGSGISAALTESTYTQWLKYEHLMFCSNFRRLEGSILWVYAELSTGTVH